MTAPSAGNVASYISLFKTRYRQTGQERKILRSKRPFYDKIKRSPNRTGEYIHTPIMIAERRGHVKGTGGLALLGNTTHSPVGPSQYKHWIQSLEVEYAQAWFDNITLKKMGDSEGAFFNIYDREIRQMLDSFGSSVSHALFRNGDGVIGTVSAASITAGSGTISLTNSLDMLYIKVGDKLNVINAASPALPRGGDYTTSYFEVTARNMQGNLLSVTRVGTNAVDSVAVGDFISPIGNYSQNGVGRIRGLAAICPLTAPTAGDSFYNIDRSVDVNRLAGWRYGGAATDPLEEQISQMSTYMNISGMGTELWAYAHPIRVEETLRRGQGRMQYEMEEVDNGEYTYGLKKLRVVTQNGDVNLYPTPECPLDRWYGLNDNALSLGTLGEEPEIIETGGISQFRISGADGFGVEARLLAQVLLDEPGDIVTGSLA